MQNLYSESKSVFRFEIALLVREIKIIEKIHFASNHPKSAFRTKSLIKRVTSSLSLQYWYHTTPRTISTLYQIYRAFWRLVSEIVDTLRQNMTIFEHLFTLDRLLKELQHNDLSNFHNTPPPEQYLHPIKFWSKSMRPIFCKWTLYVRKCPFFST